MSESPRLVPHPVIRVGGSGARLCPFRRSLQPKQRLSLGVCEGNEPLFQQAVRRAALLANADIADEPPCVVAYEAHRFTLIEQLRDIGIVPARILLEPFGRNASTFASGRHGAVEDRYGCSDVDSQGARGGNLRRPSGGHTQALRGKKSLRV